METDSQFLQRQIDEQVAGGRIVLPPGHFHLDAPLVAKASRSQTDWFVLAAHDTILIPVDGGKAMILPYPSWANTHVDLGVAHPDTPDQPYVHQFGYSKDPQPYPSDWGRLTKVSLSSSRLDV